jgi:hypothetical protein
MCTQESFEVVACRREGQLVRLTVRRPNAPSRAPPSDQDAR